MCISSIPPLSAIFSRSSRPLILGVCTLCGSLATPVSIVLATPLDYCGHRYRFGGLFNVPVILFNQVVQLFDLANFYLITHNPQLISKVCLALK